MSEKSYRYENGVLVENTQEDIDAKIENFRIAFGFDPRIFFDYNYEAQILIDELNDKFSDLHQQSHNRFSMGFDVDDFATSTPTDYINHAIKYDELVDAATTHLAS